MTDNYKKHTSKNPLQKFLLNNFYKIIFSELQEIKPIHILDVGCGEGFTLERFRKKSIGKKIEGLEYSDAAISLGKKIYPHIKIVKGTIYDMPYKDNSFDLVTCLEVLEHLQEPEKALLEIHRVTSKYALFSVPNEPFFMLANFLRGKNIARLGNDIEHIQHWTFISFKKFVGQAFSVLNINLPFPWTVILARKSLK